MNFNDIFTYEEGKLLNKKTKHEYCNLDRDGYIRVRILGKEYRAHRIIWTMFNGEIPEGLLIDHIDGNVANNSISNLRLATRQQNKANSNGIEDRELPKGVTRNPSGKFRARLHHKGTTYSLGTFKTVEEAANAYNSKTLELNGEFAKVNIILH